MFMEEMMKICFITTISDTLSIFVTDAAKDLLNRGHEVFFICNKGNKVFDFPERVTYIELKQKRGLSLSTILNVCNLMTVFKKNSFDIIQYATPNASLTASVASFLTGTKIRIYAQWGIYYINRKGITRCFFKMMEKITCLLSTNVQPISRSILEFSISEKLYSKNKGSVIGYGSCKGINFEQFDYSMREQYRSEIRGNLKIPLESFTVGFLARINKEKGIVELLNGFRLLSDKVDNAYLLVCGPLEDESLGNTRLFEWARQQKNIIFCGQVSNVQKFYSAMDVFVYPSYREGFGEASLEAQSMGTPVIVTDIPGLRDTYNASTSGLIVDFDLVNLSDKIKLALECVYNNQKSYLQTQDQRVKWVKDNFDSENHIRLINEFKIQLYESRQKTHVN